MSLKTNVGSSAVELPLTIGEGDGEYGSPLDAPSSPTRMRYSSLSLKDIVCLCAGPRDNEVWEEFVSRVGKPISLTIIRTASLWGEPSLSLVEDLVQTTYAKLWKDSCRHLRDFAIKHPSADDAILRYIRKTAANATRDYFKRDPIRRGDKPHVSTSEVDPEAGKQVDGSQESMDFRILLKEIDEHLKHCLAGPDQRRDRTIFWLYFRQGMSCKEIASQPTIGLSAKGVGSVIERSKHCLREQILRLHADSEDHKE